MNGCMMHGEEEKSQVEKDVGSKLMGLFMLAAAKKLLEGRDCPEVEKALNDLEEKLGKAFDRQG